MSRNLGFLLFLIFPIVGAAHAQATRRFTFHYGFTVRNIPAGEQLRVWIPVAESNEFQEVKVVQATGDLPLKRTRESKYGNQTYFAETPKAKKPELHFEIVYDIVRHERIVLGTYAPHLASLQLKDKERNEFLAPDRLVPVTGEPAQLAAAASKGEATPLDKAHAIYDYVFSNMSYDKTGTGWGRGDALYACSAKKGNCTDFHSLFIAMARSQGIPARFEIGFPLPPDAHSGDVTGYHCWADFFEPQHGWVPVDISEAWRHPEKRAYFFGALDANRVQFTTGRDLQLNPKQAGPPLNYFIYPYVELDGKEFPNVSLAFSFADEDNGAP
ncbi:MAG: transglutaminase-like domain-containing protein [Terriglobales bacterium]